MNPNKDEVEEYNGTSWTAVSALPSAKQMYSGAGADNTSVVAFAGEPQSTVTLLYNGTAWATTASMGSQRYATGAGGTSVSCFAAGGGPGAKTNTEEFTGAVIAQETIATS